MAFDPPLPHEAVFKISAHGWRSGEGDPHENPLFFFFLAIEGYAMLTTFSKEYIYICIKSIRILVDRSDSLNLGVKLQGCVTSSSPVNL